MRTANLTDISWGLCWACLGLGCLGPVWGSFGWSFTFLEAVSGLFWSALGLSQACLGLSWVCLGPGLGCLGPVLGRLGLSWACLWVFWVCLGPFFSISGVLKAILVSLARSALKIVKFGQNCFLFVFWVQFWMAPGSISGPLQDPKLSPRPQKGDPKGDHFRTLFRIPPQKAKGNQIQETTKTDCNFQGGVWAKNDPANT